MNIHSIETDPEQQDEQYFESAVAPVDKPIASHVKTNQQSVKFTLGHTNTLATKYTNSVDQFAVEAAETKATPAQFDHITLTSHLNTVFNFQPLDEEETLKIEQLMAENIKNTMTEDQAVVDAHKIKEISAEIKAIGKQGVLLVGEKLYKAREILKSYVDGTFTKWLDIVMPSRKTGYNALRYYELYESLPNDIQTIFKEIAQKPAYILASRTGDMATKVEIIKNSKGMEIEALVTLIQEKLPTAIGDRRKGKSPWCKLVDGIRKALEKLQDSKDVLTAHEKEELLSLRPLFEEVIGHVDM
jgi:hypothetical protein